MPDVCAAHGRFITSVDYREVTLRVLGAGLDAGIDPGVLDVIEPEGRGPIRRKWPAVRAKDALTSSATGEVKVVLRRVTTSADPGGKTYW